MRWFPGFKECDVDVEGVRIHALTGGEGPPLLLLHGHPETHLAWRKVAPRLAEHFSVVVTDLRGYGDSAKPAGGGNHADYSKRAMAADQIAVMRRLGHSQFQAVGHDRGGRVLHRMLLDHPETVRRGVVLDIAPTDEMYARTDERFAERYFWWFFHIQEAPLPERMIESQTLLYLKRHLDAQNGTPGSVSADVFAEYLRCYDPASIRAVCEDYRASVTIDRALDRADHARGHRVRQPLTVLWGARGTVGELFDVIDLWRARAERVDGHALDCGHLIPEEAPEHLLDALLETLDY